MDGKIIKTTNPALIRRFFKGVLEPGDESKDFIIRPRYSLVFKGKMPYREYDVPQTVSWRNTAGEFHVERFPESHRVHDLMKDHVMPEGTKVVPPDPDVTGVMLRVNLMSLVRTQDQEIADERISRINVLMDSLEKEDQRKAIGFNSSPMEGCFELIFSGLRIDISELSPVIRTEIMKRRIKDGNS